VELSAGLLFCVALLAAVAGSWHANLAAREAANAAAVDACARLRLQFLDGTVAFAGFKLARGPGGWLVLRRTYTFDYTSDTISRRSGFVIMTGRRIESIGFDHAMTAQSVDPAVMPDHSSGHRPTGDFRLAHPMHPDGSLESDAGLAKLAGPGIRSNAHPRGFGTPS
jgi:hypothetical protein